MKHIHHIIPKHMGGTDDPSNLVELTIEEHAAAHLKLYELHGRKQDLAAYLGLSGLVNKKEIYEMLVEERRGKPLATEIKEKISKTLTGRKHNWGDKISESHKGIPKPHLLGNTHAKGNAGKPKTEQHRENISKSKQGVARPDMFGNTYATSLKGRKKTLEHQLAINAAINSPEVKQKAKLTWESKSIVQCPHCGVEGKQGHNMSRFHFANCKKVKNG